MKRLNIIHLGIGNVGKALVGIILENKERLKKNLQVNLNYCGLFNSKGGVFRKNGLKEKEINQFPHFLNANVEEAIDCIKSPFLLIDTTPSDKTFSLLLSVVKRGGYVVVSNKKPLASKQKQFDLLHKLGDGKLFYETTVGAALPVISTLKNLLSAGDQIIEIKGCFSGTLGYLFSSLESGNKFSEAVFEAKQKGYTEPDPRDDLSGIDVARKALILARIIGRKLELSDIRINGLYPPGMNKLAVEEFLKKIVQIDGLYYDRFQKVKQKGETLRFVAKVTPKICQVGIESVKKDSDLGSLSGPDNIIVFRTKRYLKNPLVIKGSGAGVEVTASGVLADILTIAGRIAI